MKNFLISQLKILESKQSFQQKPITKKLRVFYGWAKLGKIRKREGISIIYENQEGSSDHYRMGKVLSKAQHTVCWRFQTEDEAKDVEQLNRVFTEYSVFMDDKKINGSLEAALRANSLADQNNVSQSERKRIEDELRKWYLNEHKDYKEPIRQLELFD